jgi:hypothetical protein
LKTQEQKKEQQRLQKTLLSLPLRARGLVGTTAEAAAAGTALL